jgi:outer membrane protein assembly factor BamB
MTRHADRVLASTGAKRVMTLLAGCALCINASSVQAQDWPQWRGPNRDGKVTGFSAPRTWPKDLTRKWKVDVGLGDATPALVGDKLYVFARQETNEITRCLDAGSGKELWQNKYAAPAVSGPDAGHGGPRSSPAVADGKIVTLGVCGTVSCLDATTGNTLWRKTDFPSAWPQFHTAMSPIVVDDMVVVQLGNDSEGAVVAYDLVAGAEKWKWTGEGAAYASPMLLTIGSAKMIITLTAKSIIGISTAHGKLLWRVPFMAQGMPYNIATPIVDGQTVIYSGQGRGTKAVKIERQGDHFTARELWNNSEKSVAFNSPVLKNGLIFALSQRGKFFCVHARTGRTAWTESTGGRGDFGSIVDAGSVLLGLTATSQLIAFQPSAEAYVELAHFTVSDKQTYAHPVVAGNRLFVRDQDSVTLWTIE